jgi:RNA polymerase sigma-70 factor, ECF subfamily
VQPFDEFFTEHRRALLAQAYALTGDPDEAQDLVQEAFFRTWQHWEEVSQMVNPTGWVRTVLYNLAMGRWRRRRLHDRHTTFDPPQSEASPDETHLDLARALRRLPKPQRTALLLHHVVGMPVSQVAIEMQAPEGSIRGWLSRGRAALAKALDVESTTTQDGMGR